MTSSSTRTSPQWKTPTHEQVWLPTCDALLTPPDYSFTKAASLGFIVLKALTLLGKKKCKNEPLLLTYRCWVRK